MTTYGDLDTPSRVLLGPGPSNVHPRVTRALTAPVVGYLDPAWFQVMDETMGLLRQVYQTNNRVTFPLSGTGTSGMEALLYNVLETGDEILIGVNGYFGNRLLEMATRSGAKPTPLRVEWGKPIDPERVRIELKHNPAIKVVAVVSAETSTGVQQPLASLGEICQNAGALLLVDCVTSLGGIDINVDAMGIDLAYSCTQKCLGCPPGLSPITVSDRAWESIKARKTPSSTWYLDLKLLEDYWAGNRGYHHTPPASMIYGLREGLRIVLEEGLDERVARHAQNGQALVAGLEAMGMEILAGEEHRLPVLTAVRIPSGADDARVRAYLRDQYNLEIGGGLGALRGQLWRIGLMGASSTSANVLLVLAALEDALAREGASVVPGAGPSAAATVLSRK